MAMDLKTVETRQRFVAYRGPVAIHAAVAMPESAKQAPFRKRFARHLPTSLTTSLRIISEKTSRIAELLRRRTLRRDFGSVRFEPRSIHQATRQSQSNTKPMDYRSTPKQRKGFCVHD
jgi:hypothetical protein